MKSLSLLFLALSLNAYPQTHKAEHSEKKWTAYLNNILKHSESIHWAYKDRPMTIDSAFAINSEGILSVTVRYHNADSGYYRVRWAVPVTRLTKATEDLYYVYESAPDAVQVFETAGWNRDTFRLARTDDLFFIGLPRNNKPYKKFSVAYMQRLLDNVKKEISTPLTIPPHTPPSHSRG